MTKNISQGERKTQTGSACLNKKGEWVEAIPEPWFYRPFFLNMMACNCGKMFWSREAYEGHYALKHILHL